MRQAICTQDTLKLTAKTRGFHLITTDVAAKLATITMPTFGTLHLFLQHTSASLAISENTCDDVALDLEQALDRLAPEKAFYRHSVEGSDDMPAHIKNVLLGTSLTLAITHHTLNLGTWQGIFLCEHRNHAPPRKLILTIQGWND
ncbi:MAG TPA: hypothetical protein DCG13_01920 [Legionellales bacterium]|nr:hypothetical protein [Legionellales bacterium]HCA90046.1 hypothetical protein [Legionellales bacterium]|tara:strand:- start:1153 stop:1587 length:435 start_codon:yes stop_codon:yes gene_type:complete